MLLLDDETGNHLEESSLGSVAGFFGVVVEGDSLLRVTLTAVGGSSGPSGSGAGIGNYGFDNVVIDLAPWTDLGGASVGPFASPRFDPVGTALPGSSCALRLTAALQTPVVAVVVLNSTSRPIFGGVLHAFPDTLVSFVTDASGRLDARLTWPQNSMSRAHVWIHFVALEPAAPGLLILSDAVLLDAP
jgi:hypothetical protein